MLELGSYFISIYLARLEEMPIVLPISLIKLLMYIGILDFVISIMFLLGFLNN